MEEIVTIPIPNNVKSQSHFRLITPFYPLFYHFHFPASLFSVEKNENRGKHLKKAQNPILLFYFLSVIEE